MNISLTRLKPYSVALLVIAFVLLIEALLDSVSGAVNYTLFSAAVAIAAWYGGIGPGLLATGVSVLSINYWFIEPRNSFHVAGLDEVVRLGVFLLVTLIISSLHSNLRFTKQRAEMSLRSLHASERRYRQLIDTAYEGVWSLDMRGRTEYVNPQMARMLGYAVDEMIGRSVFDFLDESGVEKVKASLQRRRRGISEQYDLQLRRKDGTVLWAIVSAAPILDEAGEITGTFAMLTDVSDRKSTEEALRSREDELRLITDSLPVLISYVDADQQYRFNNQTYERWFGHPAEEFHGKHLREVVGDEAYQSILPYVKMALAGQQVTYEAQLVYQDAGTRYISGTYVPHEREGKIVGFVELVNDITGQKQVEAALRESEARFHHLADTAPMMVWMSDLDDGHGRSYFNTSWLRLTGRTLEQEQGDSWTEGLHPDDRDATLRRYDMAVSARQPFELEYRLRRHDGEYRWIADIGVPRFTSDGRYLGYMGSCLDISDRKQAELEIRQLNETLEQRVQLRTAQLEAANRELEAFSYSVSHDLRAPFRHINGFVDLLQKRIDGAQPEQILDATSQHYLKVITETTQRAGTLIDDLLAFSRIGRAEMRYIMVDLNSLVQDLQRELGTETQGRMIDWHIGPLPQVLGDPAMLRQVFRNLLENAVKYTKTRDRAEITVGCTYPNESTEAIVFIKDNGIGFDMRYASKLFGIFQRLHNDTEFEGTGIGLASVQRIIHRHQGRIWAEASPDGGATFYLSLPNYTNQRNC